MRMISCIVVLVTSVVAEAQNRVFNVQAFNLAGTQVFSEQRAVSGPAFSETNRIVLFPAADWREVWISYAPFQSFPFDMPEVVLAQRANAPRSNFVGVFMLPPRVFVMNYGNDFPGIRRADFQPDPPRADIQPFGGAYGIWADVTGQLGSVIDANYANLTADGNLVGQIQLKQPTAGQNVPIIPLQNIRVGGSNSPFVRIETNIATEPLSISSQGDFVFDVVSTPGILNLVSSSGRIGREDPPFSVVRATTFRQLEAATTLSLFSQPSANAPANVPLLQRLSAQTLEGTLVVGRVQPAAGQTNSAVDITQSTQATFTIRENFAGNGTLSGVSSGAISLGDVVTGSTVVIGGSASGTVDANVTINSTSTGSNINFTGSIPAGRIVRINGNHAGTITTGTTGNPNLGGQIIINSLNNNSTWSGIVRVGGAAGPQLAPVPYYDNAPSILGGGAVGRAPFALHDSGSRPVQDSAWSPAPLGTSTSPTAAQWDSTLKVERGWFVSGHNEQVRIRFYGPVSLLSDASCLGFLPPFKVERSADATFNTVVDVSHLFSATLNANSREVLLGQTTLSNSCQYKLGYYRVVPTTTPRINSGGGVTGSPAVQPFVFYFRVTDDMSKCSMVADVAGPNQSVGPDDNLTADDIIVFLGWYFGQTMGNPNSPADLKADIAGPNQSTTPDGQLSADDIINFLSAYFQGCSGSLCNDNAPQCSEEPGGGEGGGEGEGARAGGEGMMASPTNAGPSAATEEDPAVRLVQMIAAEPDPAKKALLEFALGMVLAHPQIGTNAAGGGAGNP